MATKGPLISIGPSVRALDPWLPGNPARGKPYQLLSDEERAHLATIASVVRFKKGEVIYSIGAPAKTLFNIISGVVKIYFATAEGQESIVAFLSAEDMLGLATEGKYTNSARALTPVTAYALPTMTLRNKMLKNAFIEYSIIAKLCQDLRVAQRHAFLLVKKHALTKLTMFLQMQEHVQATEEHPEIYLPMDRSDIADYVGLSLGAVSRGFGRLAARGVIQLRDRHHVKITDRKEFEKLAAE